MFNIDFADKSKKFLKKLDKHIAIRIVDKLENLKDNPVPSDSVFIGREEGEKVFRYRIGDYRALYKLKESEKIILVIKIDKRSKVYD
ncbi:MAG: type II toxin-antitoxin system RelE/ParE family toxin [Nanoarchaeota archaeon]|nr:type II toxin-antitoxin system RelE/ParE family toxin [Nanoarchaeota archaeon]